MSKRRVLILPALLLALSGCGGGPDEADARASCAMSVGLHGYDTTGLTRFDYGDGHEYKLQGVTVCYATPDDDATLGWEVEYVGPQ